MRVAVVSGGASGIGEASAIALAAQGYAIALIDRDGKRGDRVMAKLTDDGAIASLFVCDVSDADAVERSVRAIIDEFEAIDALIISAGVQAYGTVVSISVDEWDRVMATNVRSAFLMAKHCVPHMGGSGAGAIVLVGSAQSVTATSNSAHYVASKHAILGLTRSLAVDFAARGIRANCVLPGTVDTPMLRAVLEDAADRDAVLAACKEMHLLNRIADADEVGQVVAFLASDAASFITGAAVPVDGGLMVPTGGAAVNRVGGGHVDGAS